MINLASLLSVYTVDILLIDGLQAMQAIQTIRRLSVQLDGLYTMLDIPSSLIQLKPGIHLSTQHAQASRGVPNLHLCTTQCLALPKDNTVLCPAKNCIAHLTYTSMHSTHMSMYSTHMNVHSTHMSMHSTYRCSTRSRIN